MICKCGKVLSTTRTPNDIQLRVYTDKEWDKIIEPEVLKPWLIPLPTYDVWKCPQCGRLYFFKNGSNVPQITYMIEEEHDEKGISQDETGTVFPS